MKRRLVIALLGLTLLLAACGDTITPTTPLPGGDGAAWIAVQSPLTGRCYEVVIWGDPGTFRGKGWAGMSEVPCEELFPDGT